MVKKYSALESESLREHHNKLRELEARVPAAIFDMGGPDWIQSPLEYRYNYKHYRAGVVLRFLAAIIDTLSPQPLFGGDHSEFIREGYELPVPEHNKRGALERLASSRKLKALVLDILVEKGIPREEGEELYGNFNPVYWLINIYEFLQEMESSNFWPYRDVPDKERDGLNPVSMLTEPYYIKNQETDRIYEDGSYLVLKPISKDARHYYLSGTQANFENAFYSNPRDCYVIFLKRQQTYRYFVTIYENKHVFVTNSRGESVDPVSVLNQKHPKLFSVFSRIYPQFKASLEASSRDWQRQILDLEQDYEQEYVTEPEPEPTQ